ncbi:ribonuclease 3 [Aureimonas endophytica]|uniref:Ribonuclease 3 n=1 Tax=Aureimonas endophytica TaxID=2027858 RepID=A0A917EAD6_9HYPH|nr:ribonuclease III [Aureimonas endophytica]GGE18832.1 ribonuclease 3 [Aureimonas endophytica]
MAKLKFSQSLDELERRIGFRVADRARLERALTHASHRAAKGATNYERLEFLGDRVLGLVVSEKLFEMFPKSSEGDLSLKLNQLVSADACAEIADAVGLPDFIRHGGGDLKKMPADSTRNIRADVVESLIAAIYLGNGLDDARRFILRFWADKLGAAATARRDPKTALQEWVHTRTTVPPRYEIVARTGPDHDPIFTVRTVIDGLAPAEGQGRSRRLAEQEAATAILIREAVWKEDEA